VVESISIADWACVIADVFSRSWADCSAGERREYG
jgi:hypothetical protein